MRMKRCTALILSAAMVMSGLPSSAVLAAEEAGINSEGKNSQKEFMYVEQEQETGDLLENLPDNDELFAAYVDGLFFGNSSVSLYAEQGEKKLQGLDLKAYELLKEKIHQVAMGEAESSRITISLEELGITKRSWTAEELGVESIVEGNAISQEAKNALSGMITPSLSQVLNYLLVDCPWDLYWYDKTALTSTSSMSFRASNGSGEWVLSLAEDFTGYTYQFPVAEEYRDSPENPYVLNTGLVQTAGTAAENARQIVEENADLNDFEKMTAYKNEICELVSYNHEAAGSNVAYGNPWQLIWVFDGDPDTDVVCEGYSKAFQYLCDMSVFRSSNTACYTVTGIMDGGTGAGRHMWNIATMGNQENYIVDVTNCDTGSVGMPDKLFLAGASGSIADGYTVPIPEMGSVAILYGYDSTMPEMYGDILQISGTNYEYDPAHEEDCPNHHLELVEENPASCTEDGNIAYYFCQSCQRMFRDEDGTDEILLEDTVLQALGHNYGSWTVKTEGNCTESGTEARTCSTCGLEETREIGIRHDLEKTEAKAPTCTEEGNLEYWTCRNCGQVFEDEAGETAAEQEDFVIAAEGHEYGTEWESDETGHWKTCEICGEATQAQEHTYGSWAVKTEGSCTEPETEARACSTCGYEETRETGVRHELEKTEAKEPTCTEEGNLEYWTCRNCGQVFEDEAGETAAEQEDFVIAAEGHEYGTEWESDETGHYHTCIKCQEKADTEEHTFQWIIDREPTEESAGLRHEECTVCGYHGREEAIENPIEHEHEYSENYESDGSGHWKICEICGEATQAQEHTYGSWAVKTEGSCTEPETEARTCSTCGYEETRETGVRHDLEKIEAKEPTCTEAGNLEYWTCRNCGQVFGDEAGGTAAEQEDFVIAAEGHEYGTEWESDETGHYHTCLKCQEKADTEEHTFQWIVDREPTEESAGLRHEECTVCEYRGREEAIENPIEHEHQYSENYESDGSGHWKICEICGEATQAQEHTYGSWAVKTEGSCTEPGTEARTCSTCGLEETRETGVRHELEKTEAKEPTCTEEGNLEYWTCRNCGQVFGDEAGKTAAEREDFVIAAEGHEYGPEWESDDTGHYHTCVKCHEKADTEEHTFQWIIDREPTEESAGLRHEECTVCGYRGREETIENPIEHEHQYSENYESDGNGHWKICEICGEAAEAEGHTYGDEYATDGTSHWKVCEVCGRAAEAEEHTYGDEYITDETGHWKICEVCGEAAEAEEHTYGDEYVTDGTSHWKECEICGKPAGVEGHVYGVVYSSDETGHWIECEVCKIATEAEAHDFGNWTVKTEGTCTEPGIEARTCNACGFEETRETGAQHDLEKTEAKDPTCTEAGNLEYWSCKNCGQVFEDEAGKTAAEQDDFEIAATGHRYGEWIIDTPPTCTQDGTHQRICSICDHVQTEYIPAAGHDWEESYRIDLPATCTDEGSRSRRCQSCGEISAEVIPAIGHSMRKIEAKEATCAADGNVEYYTCLACRKNFLDAKGEQEADDSEIINTARIPHQFETTVIPATIDRNGLFYRKCTVCGSVADSKAIECPNTVTLSYTSCIYDGKAKKPSVTISDRKGNVISPENYTVSYSQNKNVGTAAVSIAFKGDYSGTITRTFTIRAKGTSISKLKAVSKGFTVTWKKNKKQTTGYQIQYAVNKKFKKAKTRTYEGVTKATVLKLKAKKKYYIRVRTYKTVDGIRIYSNWSGAKTVKTKK